MNTNKCKKCGETKPTQDFYKSQFSRVSGLGECKKCTKARVRANRMAKIDYYREYDRERGNRQETGYVREYRERCPLKYAAHNAVNNAVRDGRLERQPCENCGDDRTHAHHDDYTKPLEVRWLCPPCHKQWHVRHGEAKGAQADRGRVI